MTPDQLENETAINLAEYLYNHPSLAHKLKVVVDEVLKRIAVDEVIARRKAAGAPAPPVKMTPDLAGLEVREIPFSVYQDFQNTEPMDFEDTSYEHHFKD